MKKHAAPVRMATRGMATPMAIFAASGGPWLGLGRELLLGTEDAGTDGLGALEVGADEMAADDVAVRVAVCSVVAACTTITFIATADLASEKLVYGVSESGHFTPSVTLKA